MTTAEESQCYFFSTLQILLVNQEVSAAEMDFLLRAPIQTGTPSPVEFLSHQAWGSIKVSTNPQKKSSLNTCPHDISAAVSELKHVLCQTQMHSLPSLYYHNHLTLPSLLRRNTYLPG